MNNRNFSNKNLDQLNRYTKKLLTKKERMVNVVFTHTDNHLIKKNNYFKQIKGLNK